MHKVPCVGFVLLVTTVMAPPLLASFMTMIESLDESLNAHGLSLEIMVVALCNVLPIQFLYWLLL